MKIHCQYSRLVPISELKPHPKNRNKHTDEQVTRLAYLLGFYGVRSPVVVSLRSGFIVKGHGTLQAIKLNKWSEAPVSFQDFGTDEEEYGYLQADNAIAAWASLDLDAIKTDFKEFNSDFDVNLLGIQNFSLGGDGAGGSGDPETIPEPGKEIVKSGEIYILGNHRLLCGSSTNAQDVQRLLIENPTVCITDPPYSVNYDKSHESGGRGGSINSEVYQSYNEAGWDTGDAESLLRGFMSLMRCDVLVMSYPVDRHFFGLANAIKSCDLEFRKELVWVKDNFSFWMGSKYQQRHEPILWCAKKGKPLGGDIPANQSTVLEYPKPKSHDLHPTAKPIDLWSLLVKYHCPKGEIVYEPFGGSGTTIIAAEQNGCRCFAIEMSPIYCGVILERWEKFTGKIAVREDGVKWSEIKNANG